MTVHVGEVISEVSGGDGDGAEGAADQPDEWEERVRTATLLDRIERDRLRTATGYGDD